MRQPTLSPAEHESLDGFLLRLAEQAFWPDVARFLTGLRLCYGRRMIEESAKAEELLDLVPGSLAPILPTVQPAAPSLNRHFEHHHNAPVCPACLADGAPHHQSWCHVFVTCCVDHGLRLVDQCPMCQGSFLPGRGRYDSCHCGCPLDRLERVEADDTELAISALIAGQLHPARTTLPRALAFRTPSDIGEFIFFLASGGIETVTGKQGKSPLPRTVAEARGFLAGASRLLCSWPTAFQEEVARRLGDGDAGSTSAPARLGRWYQRVMGFGDDAYEDFRKILGEVVAREFDGAYVGGIPVVAGAREWVNAAEASRILHIRAERLVEAVSQGQIQGRQDTSGFGHRHTMLPRVVVDEVRANRNRFVGKTEARKFLGIQRKQYDLFVDAGGLARCIPEELPPLVDGNHDLDALRRLVDDIARNAEETKKNTVAFSDLNLRFTSDRAGLREVFRQIVDGRLQPAAKSTHGSLARFRFCRSEIEAVLSEVRRGPGMTVQQIAKMTGWKEQCIAAWCDQGLLALETYEHAGRSGRMIRSESLALFQTSYLPLNELAKQLGTSSRYLLRRFSELGVETVGSFQDGKAWRGHLVAQSAITGAVLGIG